METYLVTDAHDHGMRENLLDVLVRRLALTSDESPNKAGVMAIDLEYLEEPDTFINALNYQCGQSSN